MMESSRTKQRALAECAIRYVERWKSAVLCSPYEPHIRAELRSMTKQTTRAGNVHFTAERNENSLADRF